MKVQEWRSGNSRMNEVGSDGKAEPVDDDSDNQQRHPEIQILIQENGAVRPHNDFLDVSAFRKESVCNAITLWITPVRVEPRAARLAQAILILRFRPRLHHARGALTGLDTLFTIEAGLTGTRSTVLP